MGDAHIHLAMPGPEVKDVMRWVEGAPLDPHLDGGLMKIGKSSWR
jgi:hypothetical protein